jgi:hypothetical protein
MWNPEAEVKSGMGEAEEWETRHALRSSVLLLPSSALKMAAISRHRALIYRISFISTCHLAYSLCSELSTDIE